MCIFRVEKKKCGLPGLVLSLIAGSLLFTGVCEAAKVPSDVQLAKKQVITVANGTEPKSLDPAYAEDSTSQQITNDLFEGLVRIDPQNQVHPGMASSWKVSDDGLVYTFYLRKNARWSDGSPLTADDFVHGFRRSLDPKTTAPLGYIIAQDFVKNADAVMTGKKPPKTLGIKALDAHTVEITLSTTNPHFLTDLINPVMFPIKASVMKKWGKQWSNPEHMVSNGAYKLKEWVVNGHVTLERNAHYWNNKETVINQVTYLPIQDMSAINAYAAGRVDLTSADNVSLPLDIYRKYKKEKPGELMSSAQMGIYYYDFNVNKAPFNDVRVRKALSYTVNREVLTQFVVGRGEAPSVTFLPPQTTGYIKPDDPSLSLSYADKTAEAKKLLAAAGYSASHPLEFSLMYNTMESHKKLALAIASMWNQVFGKAVKVKLENQEWKTFLDTRRQGDYQMARDGWQAGADPSAFFDILMSDNPQNNSGWKNPDYDRLVMQADQELKPEKRAALYKKAQEIILQDMPVIPLYQYSHSLLVKPYVGGARLSPVYSPVTQDLYLKKG